jgi:hypothetical protein
MTRESSQKNELFSRFFASTGQNETEPVRKIRFAPPEYIVNQQESSPDKNIGPFSWRISSQFGLTQANPTYISGGRNLGPDIRTRIDESLPPLTTAMLSEHLTKYSSTRSAATSLTGESLSSFDLAPKGRLTYTPTRLQHKTSPAPGKEGKREMQKKARKYAEEVRRIHSRTLRNEIGKSSELTPEELEPGAVTPTHASAAASSRKRATAYGQKVRESFFTNLQNKDLSPHSSMQR